MCVGVNEYGVCVYVISMCLISDLLDKIHVAIYFYFYFLHFKVLVSGLNCFLNKLAWIFGEKNQRF